MNSWLYLSAPQDGEADLSNACVSFWHADLVLHNTCLSQACEALQGRAVNLILPMQVCSWLLTEPWPGRRTPTVQALAYAIEDQLADDLEHLHLAVGAKDDQQRYPLLIIRKQWLKDVLAHLRASGLNIINAHADADLLTGDQPCAAWWDERWIIGAALDARLAVPPHTLEVIKARLPAQMAWHRESVEQHLSCTTSSAINLLQGEFRLTTRHLPWRGVSVALLLALALAPGFSHLRSDYLEHQAAQLYAQSEQRFKALYPEQTRIVDLSAQLKAMQQGSVASAGHLQRLHQLTEQVVGASSVEVQRMEWRAGTGWALNITASSFAELEQLRARGEQGALAITLSNASQQGNRVHAILTLEDVL